MRDRQIFKKTHGTLFLTFQIGCQNVCHHLQIYRQQYPHYHRIISILTRPIIIISSLSSNHFYHYILILIISSLSSYHRYHNILIIIISSLSSYPNNHHIIFILIIVLIFRRYHQNTVKPRYNGCEGTNIIGSFPLLLI